MTTKVLPHGLIHNQNGVNITLDSQISALAYTIWTIDYIKKIEIPIKTALIL